MPPIDETRPVSSAYSARALFRSPVDEPGKFAAVNIDSAGSKVVCEPERRRVGTLLQSSPSSSTRVKSPPNVKLCEPFSQLNWSTIV